MSQKLEISPEIRELFDRYDSNKDGFLSFKEVKTLLYTTRRLTGKHMTDDDVVEFVVRLDVNADNKISLEEFKKLFH